MGFLGFTKSIRINYRNLSISLRGLYNELLILALTLSRNLKDPLPITIHLTSLILWLIGERARSRFLKILKMSSEISVIKNRRAGK